MARIWTEPYDPQRHQAPMAREVPVRGGGPHPAARLSRTPTLERHRVILVRVASFTFVFHTPEELRACLAFYARKLHPSGRSAAAANAVASGNVAWRRHVQRWHERLPLYLREEPKRLKVVAALSEALRRAETGEL
jgi:hypothetical protein